MDEPICNCFGCTCFVDESQSKEQEDYTDYTTIMYPNQKMRHEYCVHCWCEPEVVTEEDGATTLIHNVWLT